MTPDRYLGCISGTSVDGLDLAVLTLSDATPSIEFAATARLPDRLRNTLLDLGDPLSATDLDRIDLLGYADAAMGDFIGHAVLDFLRTHHLPPSAINAIGSHGQTVRHRPRGQAGAGAAFTMQIGDPNRIAEITGIATVADFRRRDLAAGGQGAPLVPPFHQALFGSVGSDPVVLNVGGIGNLTLLGDPVLGFDTGPGNCLMDAWIQRHRNERFDQEGAWAASGQTIGPLLDAMLEDPYFSAPPPKSTGREYFHLGWLDDLIGTDHAPVDVQTTLCELTARSIVQALAAQAAATSHLIVCGGGRLNAYLLDRLRALAQCEVLTSEAFGVDGDAIEAAAFAWLAHRTLAGLAGNEPAVTGATGPRVLGAIYPGGASPADI